MPAGRTDPTPFEGTWSPFAPSPAAVSGPARAWHTLVADPSRDRLLLFGGTDGLYSNETWVFSTTALVWSRLDLANPPPARSGHVAVFDAARDRMIVFGGEGPQYLSDVWALSFTPVPVWTEITPASPGPAARVHHGAVMDESGQRMIVFGGDDGTSRRNDVWALSLAGTPSWTQLSPVGTPPTPRSGAGVVLDELRHRMVVQGGYDGSYRSDVWALSLGAPETWSEIVPTGSIPAGRAFHGCVYDPVGDRLVFQGGTRGNPGNPLYDAWGLSLGSPAWSLLTYALPARWQHAAAYDPHRRWIFFEGGYTIASAHDDEMDWLQTGSTHGTPVSSPTLIEASLVADEAHARLLALAASGLYAFYPAKDTITWFPSVAGGASHHAAAIDSLGRRMLVFGGEKQDTVIATLRSLDLDSLTWTVPSVPGAPPARRGHTMIYDPPGSRMIIYGGDSASVVRGDLWALNLGPPLSWEELHPTGDVPSPRTDHTAIYDPVRRRMIVWGGSYGGFAFGPPRVLDLATLTWSSMVVEGATPPLRRRHAAVYEPTKDRMLIYGGLAANTGYDDLWSLSLTGTPLWTRLDTPGAPTVTRWNHVMAYFAGMGEVVLAGGENNSGPVLDAWHLAFGTRVGVPGPRFQPVALLEPARPNPSRADVSIEFSLVQAAAARLEVYDAAGRRVRVLVDGSLGAGRHRAVWDGHLASGASAPPGLYLFRLESGGRTRSRPFVRLR